MRKVHVFKTEDGQLFEKEVDAAEHEVATFLNKIIEDNHNCNAAQVIVQHAEELHRLLGLYLRLRHSSTTPDTPCRGD